MWHVPEAAVLVVPRAANGAVGGLRGELVADSAAKTVLCGVIVIVGSIRASSRR